MQPAQSREAIVGVDVGTTTICGVAVSSSGELVASVERPNDAAVADLPTGWAEQDPGRIRERVFEVLRELTGGLGGVTCVGLTGQMHGMLCVDAAGEPVARLITWQDSRCLEPTPTSETYLDQIRDLVPAGVWEACGCRPASGFMGCTLFWMCRNDALPPAAQRVSFIHDWIGGTLTGQLPVTDPSDAGSSGLFDLARMCWHQAIVQALGLPARLLPPVRPSGEVIGGVSADAAAGTGLKTGTPVCNAVGDNQASVLGSLANVERSILINLGTGGQISWVVPSFCRVQGMETRYLPQGRYLLVGASLCGGRAFAWLNDVVRDWLRAFGCQPDRERVYERLCELAASAPVGTRELMARTTLAGTRTDPSLRGSFDRISLDNFSLANVARAVLEALVEELCVLYGGAGHGTRPRHDTVVASGNAVRKNPLLREIIAARLARPVLVPRHREEAAFGAALLAGVGAGLWPDLDTAGRFVQYASPQK